MSIVTQEELLDLAGQTRQARRLRAAARTRVSRDIPIRLRSQFRTHDRLGSRTYQPGDSVRLLILRDLLNRGQLNVRTYLALAEVFVHVVLDPSRSLLADPQAGPFAVKLAFSLALAGLWARQPTSVSFLGKRPPTPIATRPQQMGGLLDILSKIDPVEMARMDYRTLLEKDLGYPHANTNFYFLTHIGHPLERLETLLRVILARVRRPTVFLVASGREFEGGAEIRHPDGGEVISLPGDSQGGVPKYLEDAVMLGKHVGVPVEPLLVFQHEEDIETLLPLLAGLS